MEVFNEFVEVCRDVCVVEVFVYLWKFLMNLLSFVEFLCVFMVILCVTVKVFFGRF